MNTSPTAAVKPRRRWLQYSLRSLLIFVTLFAILCSWIATRMRYAIEQQAAVKALRKYTGIIEYDYQLQETSEPPGQVGRTVGSETISSQKL